MLKTFHEHTLETDLLKPGCIVLDVGCRGFEFGNELRKEFQAKVYETDIDDLDGDQPYYRCGIAQIEGFGDVDYNAEKEARRLMPGEAIKVFTIQSFGALVGVGRWDIIKLDCEGSEYDILWELQAPQATQITVEFHQHTEARRSEEFMAQLINKLEQWYEVRQHCLSGKKKAYKNYWDSLFTLK